MLSFTYGKFGQPSDFTLLFIDNQGEYENIEVSCTSIISKYEF